MKKSFIVSALFSAALLANPYESTQEEIDAVKAVGQKASASLLQALGGNLKRRGGRIPRRRRIGQTHQPEIP
ncbi:MAG: hypothetical protein P8Y51_05665 [Campylobacterales bacterium]